MRPLVAVRSATPYDPHFITRSPLFWPIERAARALGDCSDFPPFTALDRVFEGTPPVRFVAASPRPRRRRRAPVDLHALYDARIAVDRLVPTRERSWHDLLNALVWGTFPRAKRELHQRQHDSMIARVAPGAWTLPAARTPEQDALALIDEGGVVVLAKDPRAASAALRGAPESLAEMTASGDVDAVIFGHAIYESLVFGVAPAAVAAIVVGREPAETSCLGEVDAALASALGDRGRFLAPDELCRVDVRHALVTRLTPGRPPGTASRPRSSP